MIKSNFLTKNDGKRIFFENKIKQLFKDEKVDGAFIYYRKDYDIGVMQLNMCCHELEELGENIIKDSEEMAEEEECKDVV